MGGAESYCTFRREDVARPLLRTRETCPWVERELIIETEPWDDFFNFYIARV